MKNVPPFEEVHFIVGWYCLLLSQQSAFIELVPWIQLVFFLVLHFFLSFLIGFYILTTGYYVNPLNLFSDKLFLVPLGLPSMSYSESFLLWCLPEHSVVVFAESGVRESQDVQVWRDFEDDLVYFLCFN